MSDLPNKHAKVVSALEAAVRAHNLASVDAAERAIRAREEQKGET